LILCNPEKSHPRGGFFIGWCKSRQAVLLVIARRAVGVNLNGIYNLGLYACTVKNHR